MRKGLLIVISGPSGLSLIHIFFVNGRYIKDSDLSQSVQDGYINSIGTGKFPMYVLNVWVPRDMADVNVHPNKLEVRFDASLNIYECVSEAVRSALRESFKVPELMEEDYPVSDEMCIRDRLYDQPP